MKIDEKMNKILQRANKFMKKKLKIKHKHKKNKLCYFILIISDNKLNFIIWYLGTMIEKVIFNAHLRK